VLGKDLSGNPTNREFGGGVFLVRFLQRSERNFHQNPRCDRTGTLTYKLNAPQRQGVESEPGQVLGQSLGNDWNVVEPVCTYDAAHGRYTFSARALLQSTVPKRPNGLASATSSTNMGAA